MPGALSQGWPGLIFLSSASFLTGAEESQLRLTPVERTLINQVIAHETAHQWWGDLVMYNDYRDQWLVEALGELQFDDGSRIRESSEVSRRDGEIPG